MATGGTAVKSTSAGTRNSATQAVRKAVQVLNCFTVSGRTSLGVTELSALTGWSKSSVSRLLAALEDGGLVRQDPMSGRYAPGLQLVALAGAALAGDALYQVARPHVLRLAAESGETANLSVLDQGQLLTIDEAPSAQLIKFSGWVGMRHPLHGSSSGKVLLTGLSDERREAILDAGLPIITPRTTTDRGHLLRELDRVRVAGYALSVEELAEGLTSVAAPVWDHRGAVTAAISAAGPSFRFTERHLDVCIALVKEVALDASRGLGYRVPAAR